MPLVACPACGEDDDLTGTRSHDDRLQLTCGRCGSTWDRDLVPTCGLCGSTDLEAAQREVLDVHGRGSMTTPMGLRIAYRCWGCGGRDVTSPTPTPASDLPVDDPGRFRPPRT